MALQITEVPLQALLIDAGRRRQQHLGATVSGPMDWFAFEVNRCLLRLPHKTTQIELHQGRFSAIVTSDTWICAAGKEASLTINQQPSACLQAHRVKQGDVITVESPTRIAYFALSGVIKCCFAYGSQSCVVREHAGGIDGSGSALAVGDELHWQALKTSPNPLEPLKLGRLQQLCQQIYAKRSIGVTAGPQRNRFSRCEWLRFLTGEYAVSGQRSRMGYRISGPLICASNYAMRSEPLIMGTIQVPADGQPIVMMADHQTLGGYPKIAQIVRSDLPLVAQSATNESISFTEVDPAIASFNYHRILNQLAEITAPN
ncbi:biotin-dependent carboxyltransferase family protein [Alteromonas flava]|uniref:5-oxoprolinase subunit C family protein n=1 Tax=Alteromonas flava TaxID=2048003 RepID=UPI000C290A1E|nr:hypothetical protein [Alteromonas flava]